MSLDDLNLSPDAWPHIEARVAYLTELPLPAPAHVAELAALHAVLKHRPRPVLEAGIYEEVDEEGESHIVYVRAGRFSTYLNLDGSLQVGWPLPDDTSGWTRLRVLADDEVAVRLAGYFVAEDGDGDLTIWRDAEGEHPYNVLYRFESAPLFDALAAALPHRDDR